MPFESKLCFLLLICYLIAFSILTITLLVGVEKRIETIEQQLFIDYEDNNIENYG